MADSLSDDELLKAWIYGEQGAFDVFYRRHSGRVVAYALKRGLCPEDAEETAQVAFLKLHQNIERFEIGKQALPWFFTIVHNCVLDKLRSGGKAKNNLQRLPEAELDNLPALVVPDSESEQVPLLAMALNSLPENARNLVEMRLQNDLSFKEISKVTGKSEVSLRKNYSRSIEILRQVFGVSKKGGEK